MPTNYTPISQLPMTMADILKKKPKPKSQPRPYLRYQGSPHVFERATGRYMPYQEAQKMNIWGQIEDVGQTIPKEYQARVPSGWNVAKPEPTPPPTPPTTPSTPSTPSEPDTGEVSDTYDIPKLQTNIEDTRTNLESAQNALVGYQTKRYEEEYNEAGLADTKTKIADLDTQIKEQKDIRDESVSKLRQGKWWTGATITGESAEIERLANAKINNLIDQRNALANQYNTTLDEMTNKVSMETTDKQQEVKNLEYNLNWLTKQLGSYQDIRTEELEGMRGEEEWEMGFAQKLAEAAEKKSQWEKEYELKKYEAEKPEGYKPPTSYQEWQLAGSPGSFADWLKKEEEPSKAEQAAKDFRKDLQYYKDVLGYTREDIEKEVPDMNSLEKQILDEVFPEPKWYEKGHWLDKFKWLGSFK